MRVLRCFFRVCVFFLVVLRLRGLRFRVLGFIGVYKGLKGSGFRVEGFRALAFGGVGFRAQGAVLFSARSFEVFFGWGPYDQDPTVHSLNPMNPKP